MIPSGLEGRGIQQNWPLNGNPPHLPVAATKFGLFASFSDHFHARIPFVATLHDNCSRCLRHHHLSQRRSRGKEREVVYFAAVQAVVSISSIQATAAPWDATRNIVPTIVTTTSDHASEFHGQSGRYFVRNLYMSRSREADVPHRLWTGASI